MEFRRKAVEYRQNGHSFRDLRKEFGISPQTFYNWEERLASDFYDSKRPQNQPANPATNGPGNYIRKIDTEKLRQAIADRPDIFLSELAQMFGCSRQGIHHMMKKLGITKINPTPHEYRHRIAKPPSGPRVEQRADKKKYAYQCPDCGTPRILSYDQWRNVETKRSTGRCNPCAYKIRVRTRRNNEKRDLNPEN